MHLGPPIKAPRVDENGVQFRLFWFRGAHITNAHEFHAADDAAAIKLAEGF